MASGDGVSELLDPVGIPETNSMSDFIKSIIGDIRFDMSLGI